MVVSSTSSLTSDYVDSSVFSAAGYRQVLPDLLSATQLVLALSVYRQLGTVQLYWCILAQVYSSTDNTHRGVQLYSYILAQV